MTVGQVYYMPRCDEHGRVVDDGTVSRLDEDLFRWTAADPSLRWLRQNAIRLDVAIEDASDRVAAITLRPPFRCDDARRDARAGHRAHRGRAAADRRRLLQQQ